MFNFQLLTSVIFVVCILSSSQIALKGLQNREWIARVLFLLKMNKSGGLCRRNIRPIAFWIIVVKGLAFIVFFLSLM